MKRILSFSFFVFLVCNSAFGWGREGHEVIAKIAENNLKTTVRNKIEQYLGNHSIVYYAKWMDDYRHTPEYKFTHKWHVANVDENLVYVPDYEVGDAIIGIEQAVSTLRDYKELSDSTVAVNIKYLVHLVADMHCPGHIYYKGRNQNFTVNFGGGYVKPEIKTKIHSVWDQYAIQATRIWSVSEYANELDRVSSKEKTIMSSGTPVDWLHDNAQRCLFQFEIAIPDQKLAQDFVNEAMPLLETQMLYAGYRLAALLNSLF